MKTFRQTREGMHIDFNVPITARDGAKLMSNIYLPMEEGVYPVIMSYGLYGKDLHYQDGYPGRYDQLLHNAPEFFVGTSGIHHCWELLDPEKWCQWGYAVCRVDSRGAGQTKGYMHPYQMKEAEDIYDVIEWLAAQPWCNGKVGMAGTSYHAVSMWDAAALQPPHLAGFVAWEGHSDLYRDACRHGGILCNFFDLWYDRQPNTRILYGRGRRGFHSRVTGMNASGDETLTLAEIAKNHCDFGNEVADPKNVLITDFHRQTMPDLSKMKAPYIAIVNWVGQGLHLRGSVEAYVAGGSQDKYLYAVQGPHGEMFFKDWGVNLQKKFFGKYLKGDESAWEGMPKVRIRVPRVGDSPFTEAEGAYRDEAEFPLARTQYTRFYLDCENYGLAKEMPTSCGEITYRGFGPGVTFLSEPVKEEFEFTGYIKGKVFVSSETADADLFLTVRLFGPDMKEAVFHGANARNVPVAIGWQRASHRKQDPAKTREERPWLAHDELWPLKPGEIVEMDVEIWPTSIVVPAGYRIGLTIGGKDHVYTGYKKPIFEVPTIDSLPEFTDGLGQIRHDDPLDRPAEVFDGNITLHFEKDKRPYLLLPIIPPKAE